tara:strand:- start:240 stop:974 length:735 start_codon:yes stop_codon:yes gene_type:complete
MKAIIIIPSRMSSRRLPGKPLMKIGGVPMIQRVWRQAINSNIGDVYVACAEKKIGDIIESAGGKVVMTDPDLPSGTDRVYDAFKKINNSKKIDAVINLQGDMPLINPKHIHDVLEPLKNMYEIGSLATDLEEYDFENENVTKVNIEWKNNNIGLAVSFFRKDSIMKNNIYHHVGIYSYTPQSLHKFVKLPRSKNEISLNLEQYRAMDANMKIGISYVKNATFGIDTKEDLINAETIIKKKNENN